ncbi:metallophosphoesterase [Alkaliphilus serpentinus]|uniref:Metallophosphoesterase n=1 Tax=Alkaliphilus serpentinus TaxID=1482731 RepID=A0A833MF30_9FIRM|nr:metallophosphoesterase [Alkaliphilus serpentinus]KAB3532513.1 metallophosphoesterase [Alkaliphilus serpentinus]
MNILEDLMGMLLSLFNRPYIPDTLLKELKGPLLLHISDTPVDIYPYIFRIIGIVKPKYLVHTGDMVDDIKLEMYKNRLDDYYRGLAKLLPGLEGQDALEIYYSLGNHDKFGPLKELMNKGRILEKEYITIHNVDFRISHYHQRPTKKVDFNLFGHSFKPNHYIHKEEIGLNGLLNINVIELDTKRVFHLKYPVGTNRLRGMELKRIGV